MMKNFTKCLSVIYIILILGIPTIVSFLPFLLRANFFMQLIWLFFMPLLFVIVYILTAGILSLPHQCAIKEGKFPRDLGNKIYASRRLYGLCWTAIYYFKPLYFICLSTPFLKRILFRIFGYRGSLDFILYPDTWLRDLPLLNIESGVYISNRATIGTNMCLMSGDIIVKSVTIKKGALIGHLAIIGPGVTIDENAEIGIGSIIGVNAKIGKNTHTGMRVIVGYGVTAGDNIKIAQMSNIGAKSIISSNINIPLGMIIPDSTQLMTQEQVNELYNL